jgi:4-alpha-glucanotransferase
MAQTAPWHAVADVFVYLAMALGKSGQQSRRWPDKSTAVGWGACGCFRYVFSAALKITKAALSRNTSGKRPVNVPSLKIPPFWNRRYETQGR